MHDGDALPRWMDLLLLPLINLTLALVCAVTSYYLVERPFFALRDAWAARKPNTVASSRLLEARRLAPCRPVHAASPAT